MSVGSSQEDEVTDVKSRNWLPVRNNKIISGGCQKWIRQILRFSSICGGISCFQGLEQIFFSKLVFYSRKLENFKVRIKNISQF